MPTAEYNPIECIRTNVHGAENVIHAAHRERRREGDRAFHRQGGEPDQPLRRHEARLGQDLRRGQQRGRRHDGPASAVVRYGNVVGSRGSVVPFFEELAEEGATTLPITDARMTRFWITLQQGVDFVLSAIAS